MYLVKPESERCFHQARIPGHSGFLSHHQEKMPLLPYSWKKLPPFFYEPELLAAASEMKRKAPGFGRSPTAHMIRPDLHFQI